MDLSSIPFMDLHNHTIWSDGIHTPENIIQNAIRNGITAVGISDHFHTSKCNSVHSNDLLEYINNINKLKEKYTGTIQIFAGIELCMNKDFCNLETLPYDDLNKLDYVLFEYIDYFKNSVKFTELKEYSSRLSCKIGLAHTDLLTFCKTYGLRTVIDILKENNLFWELNVNNGYEYFNEVVDSIDSWKTSRLFKNLKKNNIQISVGSDSHSLDYYDIEQLQIGNMLSKHKSIKILKYDFSVSRAMHYNKKLSNFSI